MSAREVFELLTEMIRQGPGHVAAYVLGVVTVVLVLLSIHWLARRPLSRRIDRLTEENNRLREAKARSEVACTTAELQKENLRQAHEALANEESQLRQANARLETELGCVTKENQERRSGQQVLTQENKELHDAKARLETRLETVSQENEDLRRARLELAARHGKLRKAKAKLDQLGETLKVENDRLQGENRELAADSESCEDSKKELERQVGELSEQVDRLASFDGKVWEKGSAGPRPEFVPLAERKTPIIALANLKGGVGKTTLTANLGAILSDLNRRVLLVDLDYQGSLTSLCLPAHEIREIRSRDEFVSRLFTEDGIAPEELPRYCHPVRQLTGVRLIAADDPLADKENQVMARWLLNPDAGDVRYLLRALLHSPLVQQEYDYVLIDCPPRMTTACINAFTAADFLLIPVQLDRTSTEAVPRQLRSLRKLKKVVCPDLAVLGLVANRTYPSENLIKREKDIWDSLEEICEDTWGHPVHRFSVVIRQHAAFAEAARANEFAALKRDVKPRFRDLAEELQSRIAEHEG